MSFDIKDMSLSIGINGCSSSKQTNDLGDDTFFYTATDMDFSPAYQGSRFVDLRYIGTAKRVIVPETYQGKPITDISFMFDGNHEVEAVIFPNAAQKATAACRNCKSLKTVVFGKNLRNMREVCYGCVSLETIEGIPDCVTNMNEAFSYCINLKVLPRLPLSLKYANKICMYCTSLTRIDGEFPERLEELSFGFKGCEKLESIPQFPINLWNLEAALEGCANLRGTITVHYQSPVFERMLENVGTNHDENLTVTGRAINLFQVTKTGEDGKFDVIETGILDVNDVPATTECAVSAWGRLRCFFAKSLHFIKVKDIHYSRRVSSGRTINK